MAIDWGAWEYGSGNGMRVGVEATVESISHGESVATFTVKYYTENQYTMGDTQTLNLGGSIDGSITFNNSAGGSPVLRGTRTYNYTYPASSYGSSPGSRTFSATLSGAYNGITPSSSDTRAIPARPYAAPAAPTSAAATRISDESNKVSWTRHHTYGEPWQDILVQRWIYGYLSYAGSSDWYSVARISGTATTYSDAGAVPNRKYKYRVRAENSAGNSGFDETGILYTSPATPTSVTRLQMGVNQRVTWTNNVDYAEYATEVWHATNGVWDSTPAVTYAAGVNEHVISAPDASIKHKWRVRAKTTSGTLLYSAYSTETTETAGTTSPPSAPINLSPGGSIIVDPSTVIVLNWSHIPTDTSAQTSYAIQYRVNGGSWVSIPQTFSSTSNHTLTPATFTSGVTVEWQVQTWGSDPVASAWSAIASFDTAPATSVKYPVVLDLTTGRLEADSSGGGGGGSGGGIAWGSWVTLTRDAAWASGTVRYRQSLDGSLVHFDMQSMLLSASVTSTTSGNLSPDLPIISGGGIPVAARPDGNVVFEALVGGVFGMTCGVTASGNVTGYAVSAASATITTSTAVHASFVYGATTTGFPGVTPATISYTHTQGVAAATWTIDHPLTFRPSVTVVDSTGRQVEGDVVYTDADTVTVTFSGAFAGAAYLS